MRTTADVLADFAARTGLVLDAKAVARAAVEPRARRILATRFLSYEMGMAEAEEIALRAGHKPMLRQLLAPEEIPQFEVAWRRAGMRVAAVETPLEDAGQGGDVAPSPHGAIDPARVRRAVYAGRDAARVAEAARVETSMFRKAAPDQAAAHVALGELLGYPACCAAAFAKLPGTRGARPAVLAATRRTKRAAWELNALSQWAFHYVSFYPCSFDCRHALAYARAVLADVRRLRPRFAAAVERFLRMPRLYVSGRVQAVIEGEALRRGATYRAVHLIRAFEHPSASANLEEDLLVWVGFVDPLSRGRRLRIVKQRIEILRERVVTRIDGLRDAPIVIDFSGA